MSVFDDIPPRYSAPEGMHDDTVMALAMAQYGAEHSGMLWAFG